MIVEVKDSKTAFESRLHKELTLQLYQPFSSSGRKQGAGNPESLPSIHLYMSKQQLIKFKTESCLNQQHYDNPNYHNIHHAMQAPYYYSCYYYHSDRDRRRPPIAVDQNTQEKELYESIYIEDNFSPMHCCNWIEYLYHPAIYKSKKCDNMACHRRFCPKLHKNEQEHKKNYTKETTIKTDSLFDSIQEFDGIKKQPTIAYLESSMVEAQQKLLKFVEELHNLDKQEQNKISNIKNEIISLANANKVRQKSKPKLHELKKKESKPQTNFQRLFYNEKLKIIEDREHEFKMFKDKDPRRIAAMALEYISAFLNSEGGSIYFGINDQSIVQGLEVDNRWLDQFQLAIDSDGRNQLNPPLIPQKYKLKVIPVVHQKKADLKVIQIQVFPQSETQKKILTLYKKQCYLRMNASNHRLSASDIMQYMRLINIKNQPGSPDPKLSLENMLLNEKNLEGMNYKQLKEYQQNLNKAQSKILGMIRKKQKQGAEHEGNQGMEVGG